MNSLVDSQGTIQTREHPTTHRKGGPVRRREEQARRPTCREQQADVELRNQVVQANLGLVHRVARQFVNRGLTIEDLVGEGNLGLIRAAQQYDPSLGTRFSTYAYYWIREAIQAALANTAATIRLPMNISRLLGQWRRTETSLRQLQGHPPTFEEVAAAMAMDRPTQELIAKAHRVARLRKETTDLSDGLSTTLLMLDEGMTAEQTLADRDERESISRRLERLERAERTTVQLKYGLSGEPPMTFEQIGIRLGMTTAAVHKTFTLAIRKLARGGEAQVLHPRRAYESRVG